MAFFGVETLTAGWLVVPTYPGTIEWIAILIDLADGQVEKDLGRASDGQVTLWPIVDDLIASLRVVLVLDI